MPPICVILAGILLVILSNKYTFFALFLANLIISVLSRNAINECGNGLYACIITYTIYYFLSFVKTHAKSVYRVRNPLQQNSDGSIQPQNLNIPLPWYMSNWANNILTLIFIGINIYACIAYFELDSECKNIYTTNYSHLLNMLLANIVYFFVTMFISLAIVFGICILYGSEQLEPFTVSMATRYPDMF